MDEDKLYEVRMYVQAKGPLQAAGRCLVGPNRGNQAFVSDPSEEGDMKLERVYMLDEQGSPYEVIPDMPAVDPVAGEESGE